MKRKRRARASKALVAGVLLLFLLFGLLQSLPVSALGRARVLTDAELDATYAQGLSIVRISFGFNHGGGSFNFNSITSVNTPSNSPSSGATVGFLGGTVSVSTSSSPPPTPPPSQGNPGPTLLANNSSNGGSTAPPNQTSNGPPVTVTFGMGTSSGGGSVLSITATGGVVVDSRVFIRLERNAAQVVRQIRSGLGLS